MVNVKLFLVVCCKKLLWHHKWTCTLHASLCLNDMHRENFTILPLPFCQFIYI